MKYLNIIPVLFLLSSCFGKKPEKTGLEGKPMPSFKLFLADSSTYFDTKNIAAGKPTILLYFGPYCPYSKAQVQEIVDHKDELKNINFYFITSWQFNDLKKFYRKYELQNFTNITAGVDYQDFFAEHFGAQGVPFMAIYGNDKLLRDAFIGKVETRQILSVINE